MNIININREIVIENIIHISDCHIRLFKRYDEYKNVFDTMFLDIQKKNLRGGLIVLSGDIIHTKLHNAPEQFRLVSYFLKKCQLLYPTILIAGNHDANLINDARLDSLTPIVESLDSDNLFYLKNSGLYNINNTNLVFSVMSVFDTVDKYILAKDIDNKYKKIALYHGPVNGSVTDTGYVIETDKMSIDMFKGFDAAILGDIHKHQNLKKDSSYPNIVYSSSVIQQNYGETVNNHGYVIWDLENFDYKFVAIENEYGYITFDINDGIIVNSEEYIPKKPRIRLKVLNTSQSQLKECIIDIRKKYNPDEITLFNVGGKSVKKLDSDAMDLSNIRNSEFQNTFIKDFIKRNHSVTDDIMDEILDLNVELNKKLPIEEVIRNIIWKPKIFKFSNMFSYGENNIIDFTKMGGIVGLFNSNATGKSSILSALTFCLFDKCDKAFKAINVLNNRKNEFSCELNFEVDGEDYYINKIAKRGKNDKVSVKIDFYKLSSTGEKVDLNGDARRDTASVIRSYIGDYEDFNLTAFSSQNGKSNFIEMGQTDRKDLLSQFMDISVFDKLYDLGNEEIQEYSVLLKEFKKRDFDTELFEIDKNSEVIKSQYSMIENDKTKLIDIKNKNIADALEMSKLMYKISDKIEDIDTLNLKKAAFVSKNYSIVEKIKDLNVLIDENTVEMDALNSKLDGVNLENLQKQYDEFILLEKHEVQLQSKLDRLKLDVKNKLDKADKLLKLEYDENCKFCMNNIFVKDAILAKENLEEDKKLVYKILDEKGIVDSKIKENSYIKENYANIVKIKSQYNSAKMSLLTNKASKSSLETNLKDSEIKVSEADANIELYYKSKEQIEKNAIIEKKLLDIKKVVNELDEKLTNIDKEMLIVNSKLMVYKNQKNDILKSVDAFSEMEKKYNAYEYYLESIKRDNIPYEIISKTIPKIENEINTILSQIVDFSILLDLDGKNINVKIVYSDEKYWPIEMASGMEKFITSLAIRVALVNISNLPRPTFIALDEGFSALDGENMSNLPIVFDYLKSVFDFSIIISHIDYIRDFADISLNLENVDGFSKIVFS